MCAYVRVHLIKKHINQPYIFNLSMSDLEATFFPRVVRICTIIYVFLKQANISCVFLPVCV